MLASAILILTIGFFAGQIARRLGAPPLIGMILIGIIIGPEFLNLIGASMLDSADALRTLAVMIILVKAGLGLNREKLRQQGTVALRLGFLPALCEAVVVAVAAMYLFGFDFLTGLLLGFMLGAESPAVIVPGMLRLKSLGLGVKKGIPDAILSGSALSDVLMLLGFGLLLNFLGGGEMENGLFNGALTLPPAASFSLQLVLQIGLGLLIGYLAARLLVRLLSNDSWTTDTLQEGIVAASLALALVLVADAYPIFSGYLAVMMLGFCLIEMDGPLARHLRGEFDRLWIVAEIFLFVLLGAAIELSVLGDALLPGLLLLAIGLLVGRMLGWFLSTLGSDWTLREKLFLLPGNMPKATVQAALGALPLTLGIEGGEIILALAALSILVTAPVGAWATAFFAPRLLEKGEVDPTRVAVTGKPLLLAAVNTSPLAQDVLTKAADMARRSGADVIALHVNKNGDFPAIDHLREQAAALLADIRYEFVLGSGPVPAEILRMSSARDVTDIMIGKCGRQRASRNAWIGSVAESVLQKSDVPVILVDDEDAVGISD